MKASGCLLARYLCDDRSEFLDVVFIEIRTFVDEFIGTVKVYISCTSVVGYLLSLMSFYSSFYVLLLRPHILVYANIALT